MNICLFVLFNSPFLIYKLQFYLFIIRKIQIVIMLVFLTKFSTQKKKKK